MPPQIPTDLPFDFDSDVKQHLLDGRAVVALESTIITHGMPWPENLETARAVEGDIREAGAIPATLAVMDGRVKVGLNDSELEKLAQSPDVDKLSRADLPACIINKRTGSTTVAATMLIAELAGIKVFATGGIGGVHVDVNSSFDISTDLTELAKTSVVVVCAGAKAILDLPKTFELLETYGVPVIGWRCDQLPAFWSRESPIKSPIRLDHERQLADFVSMREKLGMQGGVLVCNPLPQTDEISERHMRKMIAAALLSAQQSGVSGKAVTPYLLSKLYDLSNGETLRCNVALIRNNARLAAGLAAEIASSQISTA